MANRVRGGVTSPRVVPIDFSHKCGRPLAADLAHVHRLIVELAAYERAEQEVTLALDTFIEDFQAGCFEVTVAVHDDRVVGMALHHARYSTWKGVTWYLEDLVVTESWRGKGVGKALFNEVVSVAQPRCASFGMAGVGLECACHRFLRKARGLREFGMVERPVDAGSTGWLDCDLSNVERRMKISAHKFGGASVSDAQAIQRVGQLLSDQIEAEERAVVVVSAMGKTTNALEAVWSASTGEAKARCGRLA